MAIFTGIAALVGTLATSIGGLFTLAGATSFILKTVVGIGLSLALNAIAGKRQPQQAGFGVQGKLAGGGDVPRSFLMGYSATAGSLVYAGAWGQDGKTPNAYFTQVIALSDMPVKGLVEFWVNGERVTVLWNEVRAAQGFPVEQYRKNGKDHCWIEFFDGTQETASAFLVSKFGAAERPWAATRVGRGVAYAVVTSLVSDDLWTGFPAFRFATSGMRLYDPSRDSSVGGAGDQRYDNPASWGGDGDDLPAVQIYNLLRGIRYGDDWLYGLQGMPAARLPAGEWIAEIAKCRASVAGIDAAEPAYRAGGQFAVNVQLAEAVTALVTACHGRLAEIGGFYKLRCGAPGAPVLVIDDGMILSSSEQSFTPFLGLAQTINGIAARYPSPAEGWTNKVAPPLYRADFEELDGDRRLMADLTFELVPYGGQVQRLMSSALEEGRRARRHTFVLPPDGFILEPGDTVAWTSARNFYETKLFRVDGLIDRANLDVLVDLTEVDPADYDPPAAGYKPEVDGVLVIDRPAAQPIVDWSAEPYDLVGADGARRPGIRLSWDGDVDDVDWIEFEVRLAATAEVIHRGTTSQVAAGSIVITQSLLRGTAYEARGRYVAVSGRPTLWSSWLAVTTSDIRVDYLDFAPPLRKDIQYIFETGQAGLQAALLNLDKKVEELAGAAATTTASEYETRELVKVESASSFAAIQEERTIRATADEALAQTTTTLAARLTDAETGITGQASALSQLSTRVTNAEGTLTSQSQSLVTLGSRLTNAEGAITGQANALNSLTTTVTQQGQSINASANQLSTLSASVNTINGQLAGTNTVSLTQLQQVFATNAGAASATWGVALAFDGAAVGGFRLTGVKRPGPNGSIITTQFGISGDLVVDGTITAPKIAVGAITADKISARQITTDKITIGGVVTDNIALNSATRLTTSTNAAQEGFSGGTPERSVHNHLFVVNSLATVLIVASGSPVAGDGNHALLWRLYVNNVAYATSVSRQGSVCFIQHSFGLLPGTYAVSLTGQGIGGSGAYAFANFTISVFQSIR